LLFETTVSNNLTDRKAEVVLLIHLRDGRTVTPRMFSAACGAALSNLPPLAAFIASIATCDFCREMSLVGVTTFFHAGVFPARRYAEALNFAIVLFFPPARYCVGDTRLAGGE
jgi:predicted small integral membrane protein